MLRTNIYSLHPKPLTLMAAAGLGALVLMMTCGVGWGQFEDDPEIGVLQLTHPAGLMWLWVDAPTTLSWVEDDAPVYWQRPASRFHLRTGVMAPMGGDPTEVGDEGRSIVSHVVTGARGLWDFTSRIQFSIDMTNPLIEGAYVDLHDQMATAEPASSGALMTNFWPIPMTVGVRDISGTARLLVSQYEEDGDDDGDDDGDGPGPPGPEPPGPTRPAQEEEPQVAYLEVAHRYTLIHDALMIELTVTNTDTIAHNIGTRVIYDTRLGKTDTAYDGQAIYLPDGTVITGERELPDTQHGLPEWWVCYDVPDETGAVPIAVKGIVNTAEVRTSSGGLPDQMEFGVLWHLQSAWFDFVPNPSATLIGADWGYAAKWNERSLLPGHSRRYVSYVALGAASADYDPAVAVAAYGPRQLVKQEGDDPATEVEEGEDHYYLSDEEGRSPFPVHFYADNFGPTTIFNAHAVLDLPTGLELSPLGQPMVKSLGMISPNQLKSVCWTVRAAGIRAGTAEIKMSGLGKLVRRNVFVPALPVLPPRDSISGLEMLSIPYDFFNTDCQYVFDSLGNLTGGGANDPVLIRWEPGAARYREFPDPFLTNVAPGEGYWVYNPTAQTLVLPEDAAEVSTDDAYIVYLDEGWNQIGSPFVLPVQFRSLQVLRAGAQDVWTIEEAIAHRLLQPALFSYKPMTGEYEWETEVSAIRLDPFEGYWLLARDDIALVFPPPAGVAPAAAPQPRAAEPEGWEVELVVSGASCVRRGRALGVASVAEDGLDQADVPSPPAALAAGPVLEAAFVSPTQQAPACVVDKRPPNLSEYTWHLAITTDAQNQPITVAWPSLEALPPDMIAMLEDTVSGQKRFMRTTSSYSYDSGEGGVRLLKITVEPVSKATPVVSEVTAAAAPGGNWAISYTLSSAAAVEARVRNISGVVIKHLSSGELCTAGRNVMLWNGRSDRGTAVPNGRYLVEIEAKSPDTGQTGRVISTFAVTR